MPDSLSFCDAAPRQSRNVAHCRIEAEYVLEMNMHNLRGTLDWFTVQELPRTVAIVGYEKYDVRCLDNRAAAKDTEIPRLFEWPCVGQDS